MDFRKAILEFAFGPAVGQAQVIQHGGQKLVIWTDVKSKSVHKRRIYPKFFPEPWKTWKTGKLR